MFYRKNDAAINKARNKGIVYMSVTGHITLQETDFDSVEDFAKWKEWSDCDYQAVEHLGREFYDHTVPYPDDIDLRCSVGSVEDFLLPDFDEFEHRTALDDLYQQIQCKLTDKQFRRLRMYYVDNLSEREIALKESCGQQRISKSISAAKKIINNMLFNRG